MGHFTTIKRIFEATIICYYEHWCMVGNLSYQIDWDPQSEPNPHVWSGKLPCPGVRIVILTMGCICSVSSFWCILHVRFCMCIIIL
jgi:hypothetical protein